MAPADRARTKFAANTGQMAVWLLVCAISSTSVGLWWFFLRHLSAPDDSFVTPWWLLIIGFAVVESFVVNLHFRTETGSFSLLEIPLVFGLLFTDPSVLWMSIIIGTVPILVIVRNQPPVKVAFNAANLSLHVGVAAVLFSVFLNDADPLSPRGWVALFGAAIFSSLAEVLGINLVIGITEHRFVPKRAWNMLAFGWLVATANTLQALIAVLIVRTEPWGGLLLVGSTAILFVAYRAYVSERDHRERVEFLYNSTRTLRESSETTSAVSGLLGEAASMFRAGSAELVLFAPTDTNETTVSFSHRNGRTEHSPIDEMVEKLVDAISKIGEVPFLSMDIDSPEVDSYLDALGMRDAIIGTLRSDESPIGLLVVGNRLGNVTTFTAEDLKLFENLVEQSAVALENDQLEQALLRLRELESELSHQARHDILTGLPNRALFNTRLEEQLSARPHDDGIFLLYVDLDDFKLVNDRLGHAAGDLVLSEVALRVQHIIRPGDIAARLGGDEFAVMLTDCTDPEGLAHRIIGTLSAPFLLSGTEIRIGASVGIASMSQGCSSAELLHRADLAMYTAKERGKGSVVKFSEDLQSDQSRQQELQTDLRRAISQEEFDVVYQPIVRLDDLSIAGAEALVRWRRGGAEPLTPAAFIAEAERSGLIISIDRLVRLTVLKHLGQFNEAGGPNFFTSLNFSARHLLHPKLVQELVADINGTGADPTTLVLEVTESAFVGDTLSASAVLTEIRSLGIRVALDDFGTGYSSLSHLRSLPIDFLKIAQPFIEDLAAPNGASFVEAITGLGRTLALRVVAEGIEESEQLDALRKIGCELGQGFYFARPMPHEALLQLLAQSARTAKSGGSMAPKP